MARVPRHRHRQLPRRIAQRIQSDLRGKPQVNSGEGVYNKNADFSDVQFLSTLSCSKTKIGRRISATKLPCAEPPEAREDPLKMLPLTADQIFDFLATAHLSNQNDTRYGNSCNSSGSRSIDPTRWHYRPCPQLPALDRQTLDGCSCPAS